MRKDKQLKLDKLYMKIAQEYSELSHAVRAKVGAVAVTANGILLGGYNGTPPDYENSCEIYDEHLDKLVTKDSVIHAEMNCILKGAREGVSLVNATIYTTLSPCERCSAMLHAVGIRRLVYRDLYTNDKSLTKLKTYGMIIEKLVS
jgi:dCMP deaminase